MAFSGRTVKATTQKTSENSLKSAIIEQNIGFFEHFKPFSRKIPKKCPK